MEKIDIDKLLAIGTKLTDIALLLPRALTGGIIKSIKMQLPNDVKDYISDNNLYHITSEKAAKNICYSNMIKKSGAMISYGIPSVFFFAGLPNERQFFSNLWKYDKKSEFNIYEHPEAILHAVEIKVKDKSELDNLKIRGLADGAILCNGDYIIKEARPVQIVADLIRNKNTKEPILNSKGKPKGFCFRTRTAEEIINSPDEYIPPLDYIDYMKSQKKNMIEAIIETSKNEIENGINTEKKIGIKIIREKIKSIFTKRIEESDEEKIKRILDETPFKKKNPYKDRKFSEAVARFEHHRISQYSTKSILEDLNSSQYGEFLRKKEKSINKGLIKDIKLHGIKHSKRVAILSSIIAKEQGLIDEKDTKNLDILVTAAYYHDIGRLAMAGPHAKRSSSLLKKQELYFCDGKKYSEDDKNLLRFMVESHECKDKKMSKLMKKYNISDEKQQMAINLAKILKDADALDRCRLNVDIGIKSIVDLDLSFLRFDTSRRLINTSYQLERLTNEVKDVNYINKFGTSKKDVENEFQERIIINTKADTKDSIRDSKEVKKKEAKNQITHNETGNDEIDI